MNLPGRLARTTLGDLLGTLHRAGASGVLEIVEAAGARAGGRHRVFLSAGLVDSVETCHESPPLGELLVREGALDRPALAKLLQKLGGEPRRRAGEVLVSERLASAALVAAALRWQLRARLEALFRLPDGELRFHVRRPAAQAGPRPMLTPREFLHGRRRARAEAGSRAREIARETSERSAACRVLGVTPDADAATVRSAFRRLAAVHHPDRHPGASATELKTLVQKFTRITAAYRVVSGE
ncbi:MAG TPA: DnaJ domain-containing protein [Polyangiaceae bacterium]|jgi:DnaJ-domain-containing protein 1|nr:DnaJ domain-containing protein [Polyangiaceae bacterium]